MPLEGASIGEFILNSFEALPVLIYSAPYICLSEIRIS